LEQDKKTEIALDNAITSIVNETTVYSSLSHYLFDKIVEDQQSSSEFHVFSVYSWIQVASIVASFFALLLSLYLTYRVKAFLSIAVVAHRTSAVVPRYYTLATQGPLVYQSKLKTTPEQATLINSSHIENYIKIIEHAENYISADMLLTILVIFVSFILILQILHYYRYRNGNPCFVGGFIMLEIGNATDSVRMHWQQVAYPIATFILKAKDTRANIQIRHTFVFSRLKLLANSLNLYNKHLEFLVPVQTMKTVNRWQGRKLMKITRDQYYIALIMASNGSDQVTVAVIRPLNSAGGSGRNDESQMSNEAKGESVIEITPPSYVGMSQMTFKHARLYPEL
jgi:hypothetical protein